MAAFGDLNLPESENRSELVQRIKQVRKLGYSSVAVNKTVEGVLNPNLHKCTFKPIKLNEEVEGIGNPLKFGKKEFKQYSRLTVVMDSPNQMHSLNPNSPVIKGYDIFAVQPTTEKLFQQICSSAMEVDIIVLSQSTRQSFPLRVPTIKLAIERGIHFEICYSNALDDTQKVRHLMSNALNLIRVTKGKNVLFSSGAKSYFELRSPYDVASIAHLFGLNYQRASDCMSLCCQTVMHHAETRKTHKAVIGSVNKATLVPGILESALGTDKIIGKKRKRLEITNEST